MNEPTTALFAGSIAAVLVLAGCGDGTAPHSAASQSADHISDHNGHDDHAHGGGGHAGEDHHDEVSLGTVQIGGLAVELAQGHGAIAPGKELHLVVKLPYSDNGASVVRAWLGTKDRFASIVAKAVYAASHDDYDIHAIAPDPLPANTMWWIEIEKPDGTKYLGSAEPLND